MKEREFQFEQEWSSAFSGVEMAPSSAVWNRIEAELDRKDTGKLRRNFFIWQMVAAVSLVMAASVMVFNYFDASNIESIASGDDSLTKDEITATTELESNSEDQKVNELKSKEAIAESPQTNSAKQPVGITPSLSTSGFTLAVFSGNNKSTQESERLVLNNESLNKIGAMRFRRVRIPTPDVHKIALPIKYEEERRRQNVSYPIWAGMNIAGGASTSNDLGLSPRVAAGDQALTNGNGNQMQVRNSSKTGFGYGIGVAVGKRISKRMYIQSGLQYLVQNTQGTTNAYFSDLSRQSEEPILDFNAFKPTTSESGNPVRQIEYYATPQSFTSSLEYFSIPVQVGYLIVDRKIGWGITAGVSTDFFVKNVISEKSGELDEYVTKSRDDDSPFRPVNFSALISTEVNYNITDNYSVSLEPRYSVGLNSVTKDEVEAEESRLKSLSVGLKLRYVF